MSESAVIRVRGVLSGKGCLTARQPFLGKLEWIQEEVKKAHGIAEEKKEETSK